MPFEDEILLKAIQEGLVCPKCLNSWNLIVRGFYCEEHDQEESMIYCKKCKYTVDAL